jgi:hypothetical protein
MDQNGTVVIKAFYSHIDALSNDLFSCNVGNNLITLDAKGKVVY